MASSGRKNSHRRVRRASSAGDGNAWPPRRHRAPPRNTSREPRVRKNMRRREHHESQQRRIHVISVGAGRSRTSPPRHMPSSCVRWSSCCCVRVPRVATCFRRSRCRGLDDAERRGFANHLGWRHLRTASSRHSRRPGPQPGRSGVLPPAAVVVTESRRRNEMSPLRTVHPATSQHLKSCANGSLGAILEWRSVAERRRESFASSLIGERHRIGDFRGPTSLTRSERAAAPLLSRGVGGLLDRLVTLSSRGVDILVAPL